MILSDVQLQSMHCPLLPLLLGGGILVDHFVLRVTWRDVFPDLAHRIGHSTDFLTELIYDSESNLKLSLRKNINVQPPHGTSPQSDRKALINLNVRYGCRSSCLIVSLQWGKRNREDDVISWWRHQMETFSALLAICVGNSTVPGEFPA